MQNDDSKQREINEEAVKLILLWKVQNSYSLYNESEIYLFIYFLYFEMAHLIQKKLHGDQAFSFSPSLLQKVSFSKQLFKRAKTGIVY